MHADREVLRVVASLDGGNSRGLEVRAVLGERAVVVELGAVLEAARPGEDRGYGVRRRLLAALVTTPVARDRACDAAGVSDLAGVSAQRVSAANANVC